MNIINKLFFIEDSQLKKWGKFNGIVCLFIGICFLLVSPAFYFFARGKFTEHGEIISDIVSEYDQELSKGLLDIFITLDEGILFFSAIILVFSLLTIHNGLMYLKLHKAVKKNA